MRSKVVLVILIGIPLLSALWWFWADRRLKKLKCPPASRWLLGGALLLPLLGFGWVISNRSGWVETPLPTALYAVVLLWGLIFLPWVALPMTGLWSLASIARYFASAKTSQRMSATADPIDSAKINRRQALTLACLSLPIFGTFGTALFGLPRSRNFRIRNLTVRLASLPAALDGLRIAHVTDTHVGKFTHGPILDEIVAATNRLDADLVVFTGDLIDNSLRDLPAAIAMILGMKARAGVYLIEGNHDLFEDPKRFAEEVRASGIQLLKNETATCQIRGQALQLIGINWSHDEADIANDVAIVAAKRQQDAFPILLAHHPHAFDAAAAHDLPLTLAGHTHGGQLMLNDRLGVGSVMFRYCSGLYQKGLSTLIVSNGTGNWFPLRIHAPAEIIHLTLKRSE
jgi:uncharacterized protein